MLLKKNFIDKTFQDILTILVYFSVKGLVNTTVLINSFHFKLLKKKKEKRKESFVCNSVPYINGKHIWHQSHIKGFMSHYIFKL